MKQKNSIYLDSVKDYLVSGETFQLDYDAEKNMLVTTPKPSIELLSTYYESEEYISHTDNKTGLISFLYQTVKKYSLKKKVRLVSKLNNDGKTLLDIGAGTGDFLFEAKKENWRVFGVEPNLNARNLASSKNIFLKENLSLFKNEKFDVITLWHVLEHLPDLEETIIEIEDMLLPNGTLIIAVPNYKSFDAKYYKQYWAGYDVPRHLWHFSQNSIAKFLSDSMQAIETKPMIFDSFYVSLLSEKYKNGSKFSIKALFIGLMSNLKALFSKEYSSQIYCFKKLK